ncbi:ABC transporter ATP-binding protein [Dongia soli]|uniref:ABC transporter ATP-binding protein n=1 Tax=Dongia soli TaxID=600628 RepID=A0ABU5E5C8_9PROT|nr:ABC transporter ATP-binding protein [Dongia soli]MDY0881475.1 ABC transporter ATP-binding protein [Dongia soli]
MPVSPAHADATTPRLHVQRLTKRFGALVANDAVSLTVMPGELHCLLGENGAGKSTLSSCLYGLYRPDEGDIYVDGREMRFASPADAIAAGIGMVHQHFVLVPTFTVLENIIVGTGSGWRLPAAEARRKVEAICQRLSLSLDLDAEVGDLSVGQQQWVEIVKALYLGARLLILDEPTAVLTPQESALLFASLRKMLADGLSVILISHKMNEVLQADRVTVLRRGRVVGSVRTADSSRHELTTMMVGRALSIVDAGERSHGGGTILSVKNVSLRDARGVSLLRDVSLDFRAGEIVGLAGIAGNGQRELFEAICGLRPIDAGEITLDGQRLDSCNPHEIYRMGVGHVPEDRFKDGLVPDFSIAENLVLGDHREKPWRHGLTLDVGRLRQAANEAIKNFSIACNGAEAVVRRLSGGNAQKVILARELARASRVLLCNQPTRGLDVGVIEYVHRQILEKRDAGAAILLASEELEDLIAFCDRIAVIFRGEIMAVLPGRQADIAEIGRLMAGGTDARAADKGMSN